MVEIARAVLHKAKVIIFDEPTACLTPEEKRYFFDLVRDLKKRGVSIVFISHRGFWGADAEAFEARFSDNGWTASAIISENSDEALAALKAEGLSFRQIAERTGLSKSEVGRRLKGGGP
jgi:ABC-type polar amino acid transport system ATPase subunit